MVAIALIAQPLVALAGIKPAYGSGVYAIYYGGDHPLYEAISGSETPIYVGKADPAAHDASTPREQGTKLSDRLLEHAGTIATAEAYAASRPGEIHSIRLSERGIAHDHSAPHLDRLTPPLGDVLGARVGLLAGFHPIPC